MVRRALALVAIVLSLISATEARAFCRKTTCRTCPRDPVTACPVGGQPLVWPGACVSYSLASGGSTRVDDADVARIFEEAFRVWQDVICPGTNQNPSIAVSAEHGQTRCNRREYNQSAANANTVLFRSEWDRPDAEDAAGVTSLSFDAATGEILDADIEINETLELSVGDESDPSGYDLPSIATHEAGHFLGLAHSLDPESVMRPLYDPGFDSLRTPNEDDIAGICAIYPPERRALPCDFTPRGGFAAECPLGITRGGCSIRPIGSFIDWGWNAWVASIAIALFRRSVGRRRR